MQSPIAPPMIPASASGVSTQRSGAERVAQAGGRTEDAARAADVLAHDHHVLVAPELDVEAVVDRLDERQLSHRTTQVTVCY